MKDLILWIKYAPVILNLSLILSCLFALRYIDINPLSKFLAGHGVFADLLLWKMSVKFKFCNWHRVLIINLMFGIAFAFLDRKLFGLIPVTYIRSLLLMTSFSILISLILYFRFGCFKTAKK